MSFWRRGRAARADRAVGATDRAPDEKAQRRALLAEMASNEQAIANAADAALRRLEAQGFPGAEQREDPKRRMRAAWPLCEALAEGPNGVTAVTTYYLFSNGEVVGADGESSIACRETEKVVAALNELGD